MIMKSGIVFIRKIIAPCHQGWWVGGLNGSLRQYFSLYQAVYQRKGQGNGYDSGEKKSPNNPKAK